MARTFCKYTRKRSKCRGLAFYKTEYTPDFAECTESVVYPTFRLHNIGHKAVLFEVIEPFQFSDCIFVEKFTADFQFFGIDDTSANLGAEALHIVDDDKCVYILYR